MHGKKLSGDGSRRWVVLATIPAFVIGLAGGALIPNPALSNDWLLANTTIVMAPRITLHKDVSNAHGGTNDAEDWTLAATNRPTAVSGVSGTDDVTNAAVPVGTYVLSETSPNDSGYELASLACLLDGRPLAEPSAQNPAVTLSLGDNVGCFFSSEDLPALLELETNVSRDGANSEVTPGESTLAATPDFMSEQLPTGFAPFGLLLSGAYVVGLGGVFIWAKRRNQRNRLNSVEKRD